MTKMTQKMALNHVLVNCEMPAEVKEKLEGMLATLEKRSASKGERKPTATQVANEGHKAVLMAMFKAEPNRLFTITELVKTGEFGEELSNQRVSALVRQLKEAGLVERLEDKRKAYFRLAQCV